MLFGPDLFSMPSVAGADMLKKGKKEIETESLSYHKKGIMDIEMGIKAMLDGITAGAELAPGRFGAG
ncbi:hypothetical protein TRIP_C20467 [Candidatus Zixiibacteriota bacterium]|nr:hypothetical protein TRIP_C20467 [candidate division Zixibacteria bacterium]